MQFFICQAKTVGKHYEKRIARNEHSQSHRSSERIYVTQSKQQASRWTTLLCVAAAANSWPTSLKSLPCFELSLRAQKETLGRRQLPFLCVWFVCVARSTLRFMAVAVVNEVVASSSQVYLLRNKLSAPAVRQIQQEFSSLSPAAVLINLTCELRRAIKVFFLNNYHE